MFQKEPFEGIDYNLKEKIIMETLDIVRSQLYNDGRWFADYVRIRFKAVKL